MDDELCDAYSCDQLIHPRDDHTLLAVVSVLSMIRSSVYCFVYNIGTIGIDVCVEVGGSPSFGSSSSSSAMAVPTTISSLGSLVKLHETIDRATCRYSQMQRAEWL